MALTVESWAQILRVAEKECGQAREMVRVANEQYRNSVKTLASAKRSLAEAKRMSKQPRPSVDAKRRGDKYYIGTKPCKHCGLIGKRYTSTRKCVKCNAIMCRKHYHKTKLRKKYNLPEFNIGT